MENNLNENFSTQDPNLNQGQNVINQNFITPNQIPNEIANNSLMKNEQLYMAPPQTHINDNQINTNIQNINPINNNPEYMPIIPKPYINGDNIGEPQVNPQFNNNQQNNIPYNQPLVYQPNMNPQYQQVYQNQIQQTEKKCCKNGLIVFLIVFFCCCCCSLVPAYLFLGK